MAAKKYILSKEDLDAWDKFVKNQFVSRTTISTQKIQSPKRYLSTVLDLHGYSIHQAFIKFKEFVEYHYYHKSKNITVITGKRGTIVKELPIWCQSLLCVRQCSKIVDSRNEYGAFLITLKKH